MKEIADNGEIRRGEMKEGRDGRGEMEEGSDGGGEQWRRAV